MSGSISIEGYDPRWPLRFAELRDRIAEALGSLAAAIEHVGSTAVLGLAAKPIIDIDVLLRSGADMSGTLAVLSSLGYRHEGNLGIPGREAFRQPAGLFPHHMYVCPPDSEPYRHHLAFRDYLRSHANDATVYGHLKRRLAAKFGSDRDGYTQAKGEFIREILRRAQVFSTEHSGEVARII